MNHLLKYIYEVLMVVLVVATIITLWTESTYNSTINTVVWVIFFVDFLVRLIAADKKWEYIRNNPFLLIAIIPFDQFFQIARIVRVFYLFRIKTIAKFYILPYIQMLTYRALVLFLTLFLIGLTIISAIILHLEGAIPSFQDAILVVFGHLLFFGHRIFIIDHTLSIVLLTIVSISGVILQGLALQWVLTKVDSMYKKLKRERSSRVS